MSDTPRNKGGRPRKSRPEPRKDSGKTRRDGWYNAVTGAGVAAYDKTIGGSFCTDVVPWGTAMDVWRGSDVAARIIETPANEMLRQGFELRVTCDAPTMPGPESEEVPDLGKAVEDAARRSRRDARTRRRMDGVRYDEADAKDLQEDIQAKWEDLGLVPALWQALCYEAAYGGAAILLGALDTGTPEQPLNEEAVRSFDWITVLEPREIMPINWYDNPMEPKFGQPEIYQVTPASPGASTKPNSATTTVRIHESRIIAFPGISVSRSLANNQNGWGDSVLTRILSVLRDYDMAWKSTAVLLHDFAQPVYKIEGLAELFVNDQDDVIKERIQMVEQMRSSIRAILIDATEEFERKSTPVTGLPDLLDRFVTRVCAAADQPRTLLFGDSPGGLNATGESDIRLFYDRMRAGQDRKLRPAIERVTRLCFKALGMQEPDAWSIHFKPLWQPTEKEQAEARKIQAETDAIYITNQVLSPDEVAHSRFGGDEFDFATKVDFAAREALEVVAPPPVKNENQVAQEAAEAEERAANLEVMKSKAAGAPAGEE